MDVKAIITGDYAVLFKAVPTTGDTRTELVKIDTSSKDSFARTITEAILKFDAPGKDNPDPPSVCALSDGLLIRGQNKSIKISKEQAPSFIADILQSLSIVIKS